MTTTVEAGRKGGLKVLRNHGRAFYSRIGRIGQAVKHNRGIPCKVILPFQPFQELGKGIVLRLEFVLTEVAECKKWVIFTLV